MKKKLSKTEFKPKAFEVLRTVQEEQTPYIVTDRGKPVVEIRPVHQRKLDALAKLRGMVIRYEHPFEPVDEDWDALK